MIELLSLVTGIGVGSLFSFLKLPIPAPLTAAGVLGIIGIWLGYVITRYIIK